MTYDEIDSGVCSHIPSLVNLSSPFQVRPPTPSTEQHHIQQQPSVPIQLDNQALLSIINTLQQQQTMQFDANQVAQARALGQQRTLHESTIKHQADQQISQQNFMTTILEQIRQNRSEPDRHSEDREGENYFSNKDAIKEIPCYEKGSDIDAFFRSFESRLQFTTVPKTHYKCILASKLPHDLFDRCETLILDPHSTYHGVKISLVKSLGLSTKAIANKLFISGGKMPML